MRDSDRTQRRRSDVTGLAPRRAIVRWAWRLFRREWREQVLVVALLTVTIAAAVGVASTAYNLTPARAEAEFGSARGLMRVDDVGPSKIDAVVTEAHEWFGEIEVVGYRDVPVAGRFDPLELRAQDPAGPFGAPTLDIREGRYPTGVDEVALTDGAARDLRAAPGDIVDLNGTSTQVVGLVENPNDLDDEFGLVVPLQRSDRGAESIAILVASEDRLASFRTSGGIPLELRVRTGNEGVAAAVGVLVIAEVVLLLVSLVAAACFVVVAHRRLRQLAMLAAIGASERHLRLVMMANGAIVGVVAASIGGLVGVGAWWLLAPSLEPAVGQRIDRLNLPWLLIIVLLALAVATAVAAAWWPARMVARVPVVSGLSGRPPSPRPTQASATLAAGCIAAGIAGLAVAGDVADDVAVRWLDAVLVSLGTLAVMVGALLLSPLAIRVLSGFARLAPIAPRLALRDLGRHQSRSSMALAAISLGLGIPVAVIVGVTAAQHGPDEGNLAPHQLLVRADPADDAGVAFVADRTPVQIEELEADVERIVASVDPDAAVITLEAAIDPTLEPMPDGTREVVALGQRNDDGWHGVAMVYVARPELLERLDVDPRSLPNGVELITSEAGPTSFVGTSSPQSRGGSRAMVADPVAMAPGYTSLPRALTTPEALVRHGWESVASAWLIETAAPLTDEQLGAARDQAAGMGLTVEARRTQAGLLQLRSGATAVGILLALGILAMTVGLLRAETAGDLRVLTATGAASTVRRNLNAATAAGLAACGVVLGAIGAYVGLLARTFPDLAAFASVPVLHLGLIVVGVPTVAAAAGWLLARREPARLLGAIE